MKKILLGFLTGVSLTCFADTSGFYLGAGLGYGMQNLGVSNANTTENSPALRAQAGYQFADWLDAELGWNYITQAANWNNLGSPSSTIWDFSFTPGFTIPATPVGFFVRLGVDAVSSNLNNSWYNQIISSSSTNFEYGAGVKVNIPFTNTFVRAEYINYGGGPNNNNNDLMTTSSAVLIDAAYVF